METQQVQLGPLMGGPEIDLVRLQTANQGVQDEPLPRRTQFRMPHEIALGSDAEELVEQTAVADVHLWRLYLPLREILVPRLKLPHHEHAGEQIEVATNGRLADAETARRLRVVPQLSVIVRDHRPESQEHRRGCRPPELRQIAL